MNHNEKPLALIHTFGCQQNENDSEKIAGVLSSIGYGFTAEADKADFIIFNTCAIRENAEKKVFGILGTLKPIKKRRPELVIALCGCMANEEHNRKKIKETFRHVDMVFGTNAIDRLPELLRSVQAEKERIDIYDDELVHEGIPTLRTDSVKAGVPIMYGCNNFCSYCIVPYVRGRERSRDAKDILAEVRELGRSGFKEITLLGQNVNSYGGGGDSFARLLEAVSDTGIDRIRFMTSHPKDISDEVIRVMSERANICKSLHLPIQAGSNRILKLMNRKYTREWYLERVERLKEMMPDIALTTDVIVGFPGEDAEDFKKTLGLLEQVRFDMIYSFIFSPRRGTPAEKMEDVISSDEKKAHFDKLLEVQNQISLEKNLALVGQTVQVLAEGESKTRADILTGRTEGGKIVNFPGDASLKGQIIPVKIVGAGTFNLSGQTHDF